VDSLQAIMVVVASALVVFGIIGFMSRSLLRRDLANRARAQDAGLLRRLVWQQRQKPKPQMPEELELPSLVPVSDTKAPVDPTESRGTVPVSATPGPTPSPSSPPLPTTPTVIPAEEEEFTEGKQKADAGLSAFMIEISEDAGLSKIAARLEEVSVDSLKKIATEVWKGGHE